MGGDMILLLTYILNLFDLWMTYIWVSIYGINVEASPFGRFLLTTNLAIPYKVVLVGAALIALNICIHKRPKLAWVARIPFTVYALLAIYHMVLIFIGF